MHTDATSPTDAGSEVNWQGLAGMIATLTVFAVAQGLSYPLLSFILKRDGNSAALIGLSAAMTPLGIITSALLVPFLTRRFGARMTALACAGLAAMLFGAIGWTQQLAAWFPLRFLFGVAIGPLYVLSEVWLMALAPAGQRGRLMGLYATIASAGFALGPLSLVLVGSEGWPPFLVGIGAFAACCLCLAATTPYLPELDGGGPEASVRRFLPHAPVLLAAVFVTAAFEQAALSLLPVYGAGYGMTEASLSALLTVLIAGNVALQVPLGLLAERVAARLVLILCAAGTALCCLLLHLAIGTSFLWPLAFILGAFSFGIYTMAIVELGARFTGAMLVAGNAAFALMWGIGGMAGPPAAGAMMNAIGPPGLPLALGLACLSLAAFGTWRAAHRHA
jgi:MFS family permease